MPDVVMEAVGAKPGPGVIPGGGGAPVQGGDPGMLPENMMGERY